MSVLCLGNEPFMRVGWHRGKHLYSINLRIITVESYVLVLDSLK